MNYYEHHLGDWDADTAHLSMLEDAAYSRLVRYCYRKERAIPADISEACRQIRALSRDERKAVESVLKEFFELRDDGWHQARCDREIAAYQRKAERNREVGKLGGRPKKKETQAEPTENHGGFPGEPKQNPLQSPVPSSQTPDSKSTVVATPRAGDDEAPTTWDQWREWFDAEHGTECDPHSAQDRTKFRPLALAWVNAGVTLGQMRAAITKAKRDAKEPIAYLPSYADKVLAGLTRAEAPAETPWQRSQRERVEEATGGLLGRRPRRTTIPTEAIDVAPRTLG